LSYVFNFFLHLLKFCNCSLLWCRFLASPVTVCGLAKVAIITTNVYAENQTLIHHKFVCGALNRHFCQTAVRCWRSVCRCSFVHCFRLSWCVGLVAHLHFLGWFVCRQKMQMCYQMRWLFIC
jgi:hypothetical protein